MGTWTTWTFSKKIALGFAAVVVLSVLIAAVSAVALRRVVDSKDRVIEVNAQNLIDAQTAATALERKSASVRGFMLTGDEEYIALMTAAHARFSDRLQSLLTRVVPEGRAVVEQIRQTEADHQSAGERVMARRRAGTSMAELVKLYESEAVPRLKALRSLVEGFLADEQNRLNEAKRSATEGASRASVLTAGIGLATVVLATLLAFWLTRALTGQIGSAVQHIQSASAELQAAANQQAASSKEQGSAVSEVGTTMKELVITARQIAESAQRVTQIAEETAAAAHAGEDTVRKAEDAGGLIQHHVNLLVGHMLDLGKKSQQIGGILEIINELAEQTNILSINATIEAAGAGETGRRFGAVADEIRKLADRVAGATKEVRNLIEEIRAAVNTTVMATEGGAKSVETGTRQFTEVAAGFKHIVSLVSTTTEASREIGLSTKQQTSAVEQVHVAVANVLQAARETEASASQTLTTSSQLTTLSTDLARLIQPSAGRN